MAETKDQSFFDRYDTTAIIVPGATLLLGLWHFFPGAAGKVEIKDVSLGGFGVFAVAAYCVGHVLQAPANAVADFGHRRFGRPTESLVQPEGGLTDELITEIRSRIESTVKMRPPDDDKRSAWRSIVAQVGVVVGNGGKTERLEKYNGNYGLFRGLTATLAILSIVALFEQRWVEAVLAVVLTWAARFRMKRFGMYYARELWLQFLVRNDDDESEDVAPETKAATERPAIA